LPRSRGHVSHPDQACCLDAVKRSPATSGSGIRPRYSLIPRVAGVVVRRGLRRISIEAPRR
jgi:hypothetical protein